MIQRVQSVFLLVMALVMLTILFVPIWVKGDYETKEYVTLTAFNETHADQSGVVPQVYAQRSTIYIAILAILSAALSIYAIFQYSNRLTQIKLGALNSLFVAGVMGGIFYATWQGGSFMPGDYPQEHKIGFILPVIALIFNSLANRFIRRDERLVKDSDRMR